MPSDQLEQDREFLKEVGQKYVADPEGFGKVATRATTARVLAAVAAHRGAMDVQLAGCTVLLGVASVCEDAPTARDVVAGLLAAVAASPASLPLLKVALSALSVATAMDAGRAVLTPAADKTPEGKKDEKEGEESKDDESTDEALKLLEETVQTAVDALGTVGAREDAGGADAAEALQGACSVLVNASALGTRAQAAVLARGGLGAVAAAAARPALAGAGGLQRGVAVLACNLLDTPAHAAAVALEAGAVDAVCAALARAGARDAVVAGVGATALLKAMGVAGAAARAVEAGALEAVLGAVVAHIAAPDVLAPALALVAALARDPAARTRAVHKGGLAAATLVLRRYGDKSKQGSTGSSSDKSKKESDAADGNAVAAARAACLALMALTAGETEAQRMAEERYGAAQLLCGALRAHGGDAALVCYAAGALGNLAACAENAPRVADAACGARRLLVAAMARHAAVPDVQARCASALCNIAIHAADDRAAMCTEALSALGAVLAALEAHGASDARVALAACQFLGNVARDAHGQPHALPDGRVAPALARVLAAHAAQPLVAAAALSAAANYALCPANVAPLAATDGLAAAAAAAMRRSPGARDVQAFGALLFANLLAAPAVFALAVPPGSAVAPESPLACVIAAVRRHCDARDVLANAAIFVRTLLKSHALALPPYVRPALAQALALPAPAAATADPDAESSAIIAAIVDMASNATQ